MTQGKIVRAGRAWSLAHRRWDARPRPWRRQPAWWLWYV